MAGKESDRFKKKWLEWAFNLPEINLNKLSAGKLHLLKSEAIFFCSSQFQFQVEESFFEGLTVERYTKMEKKISLGDLQQVLLPVVKFITSFAHHPNGKLGPPVFNFSHHLPDVDFAIKPGETGQFEIVTGSPVDYLSNAVWNLSKLIDHLPMDSLIMCKGCQKFFIDLTKKKKIYCNSSCAARHYAQAWREDLKEHHRRKYKAYLKNQKERMSKIRSKLKSVQNTSEAKED